MSLAREGDDYIVTVEELVTPEIFGIALPSSASMTEAAQKHITKSQDEGDHSEKTIVKFEEARSTGSTDDEEERVPPPFQEEEVSIACGMICISIS